MIKKRNVLIFFSVCCISGMLLNCFGQKITDAAENIFSDKVYAADNECDISYIVNNEKKDAAEIEGRLDAEIEAANISEMISDDGNVDYKQYFNDTVFVGDSITEYLSAAEMLPQKNVYAEKGKTVIKGLDDVEKLKYENPKRIIMLFGMNDVVNFSNCKDYKERYIELVNKIKSNVPNAKIYIESPTPIRLDAENSTTGFTNKRLDEFRQAAKEVAEETGSEYIDITQIIVNDDFFEVDGIHFKRNFYDALFKYLAKVINDAEL